MQIIYNVTLFKPDPGKTTVLSKVDNCYFQESTSTCQKFFLESRSSVKIVYFLESRK